MDIRKIILKNKTSYLKDLEDYIAIPSISADSTHKKDIAVAAKWVAGRMKKARLRNVKLIKTKGNPIVYGDFISTPAKKTVLIYGHYDVQPPDPLKEWRSDPFVLTIKEDLMFGRGVSDNKAPNLSHILGVELLLKSLKTLPVNVKFIFEGEEEVGSDNFGAAIKANKKLFKSDLSFVADGEMDFANPVIEYGLRGTLYTEISVRCLAKDVHSGTFGGVVDNPANVLSYIISKLKDRNGKILVPGIYTKVRKVSREERALLKQSETSPKEILENTGAKMIFGEKGLLNHERIGTRPTLDVNGMWSGFTGEGSKTIIPSTAFAKVSMRLVPNLSAKYTLRQLSSYIRKIAPKTCDVCVKSLDAVDPVLFNCDSDYFKVGGEVLKQVFGVSPKFKLVGATIGAVKDIKDQLKIDCFSTGFSLPDCGMHSPNEKFRVSNFLKAIEFMAKFLIELGK